MILDALSPLPAVLGICHPGQDRRVLDWDHRLIIVAIERPGLDFFIGALAAVQPAMEAMQIMVALGPDLAQAGFEFVAGQGLRGNAHREISMPSWAMSQPARAASKRWGESSISTGFVLLI